MSEKSERIKESLKATQERWKGQQRRAFRLKLDGFHLSQDKKSLFGQTVSCLGRGYEKLGNKKQDARNKFVAYLFRTYNVIAVQDETIAA